MKSNVLQLKKMIGAQCYLMLHKQGFWFSLGVMLFINMISYLSNVYHSIGRDVFCLMRATDYFSLAGWNNAITYITIFFPILIAFPVAYASFDEEAGKSSVYGTLRSSYVVYYAAKAITAFVAGAVLIWIPCGINLFWNAITFVKSPNGVDGRWYSVMYFSEKGIAFEHFYHLHPMAYGVIFVLAVGIFAGLCSVFAYSVSNFIRRYKVLCVLPVFLLFFVTGALQYPGMVINEYLEYPWKADCVPGMLWVSLVLLVVSVILLIRFIKKKEFV